MIRNMTPHQIHILNDNLVIYKTFWPAGLVRLKVSTEKLDELEGIPTSRTIFGEADGLPEEEEGTFIIVSQMVQSALPERKDLLIPAEIERNERGTILGCRSLGRQK